MKNRFNRKVSPYRRFNKYLEWLIDNPFIISIIRHLEGVYMRDRSSTKRNPNKRLTTLFFKLFAVVYLSFCIAFLLASPTTAYFQDFESAFTNISAADNFGEGQDESDKTASDERDKPQTAATEGQQQENRHEAAKQAEQSEKSDEKSSSKQGAEKKIEKTSDQSKKDKAEPSPKNEGKQTEKETDTEEESASAETDAENTSDESTESKVDRSDKDAKNPESG